MNVLFGGLIFGDSTVFYSGRTKNCKWIEFEVTKTYCGPVLYSAVSAIFFSFTI